jgi:Glycosyl hydrolases family 43
MLNVTRPMSAALLGLLAAACARPAEVESPGADGGATYVEEQELSASDSMQWARAGSFTKIYDPSTGETSAWFLNDHSIIQDTATGTWHLFAITDREPLIPPGNVETSDNFAHATAPSLQGPWTKVRDEQGTERFALTTLNESCTASTCYHESHLWAPHVIRSGTRYYMFYAGGHITSSGAVDKVAAEINLAWSDDLYTWTRSEEGPLFTDGYEARDPMVFWDAPRSRWIMYYTATADPTRSSAHIVAYRTSTDLLHWGPRNIAFTDPGSPGTDAGGTESPYVVQRNGWYYLFIGPRPYQIYLPPDYPGTEVYASQDPTNFSVSQQVGHLAAHAVEVIDDGTRLWATHTGWAVGGLYLAPLDFNDAPVNGSTVYALTAAKDAVLQRTGSTWTPIGGAATRLIGAGFGLFAVQPNGSLARYTGTPNSWTVVSGAASGFAVNANALYRRNAAGVWKWDGSGSSWTQIGGPMTELYAGAYDVYGTSPSNGDIYRYTGTPNQWTRVGNGGGSWAVNVNGLYGRNSTGVYQWSGLRTYWVRIGGPAGALYAGGNNLYATVPLVGDLNVYGNATATWSKAAGSASSFAACDDALYALRNGTLYRQTGPNSATSIGTSVSAAVCAR